MPIVVCVIPLTEAPEVPETGTRAVVRVRFDVFDALCNAQGLALDIQRADALGIHRNYVGRLRKGDVNVGGKFIAATLNLLKVPFEVVFERRSA